MRRSPIVPALGLLLSLAACRGTDAPQRRPDSTPAPSGGDVSPLVERYQPTADRIIDAVLSGNGAWGKLEALCDGIGHRLSGSKGMEEAVEWAAATMAADGHEAVRKEPVQVPHWVRGEESLHMLAPEALALPILGLGGSVGTPPEGITAEVAVVADEAGLEALGERAKGRIVLFNNPMPAYTPEEGHGYGKTVRFRVGGADLASAKGAVAVLVRSVTAHSLRTPHTGMLRYKGEQAKIPAAAVTIEDAALIARLSAAGKVVEVTLRMGAKDLGEAPSANVVGELRGTELPDEIVVIGGHLDSWDTGQGAHDDGGGCVAAMEALTVLRKLGLRPRRTIRVVLWTNEENGLAGAKAYAKAHEAELAKHVAAIESDMGVFAPIGYGVDLEDDSKEKEVAARVEGLLPLLARLGPQSVETGFGGADVSPMKPAGVPTMGLRVDVAKYFDYHHSPADTLDKVDPDELSRCVASLAVMSFVLADMPGRLVD
jgi:carboxypeptidase Q